MPNKQGALITSFGKILDSPCSLSTFSTQFIFSEFSNEGKKYIYSNITSWESDEYYLEVTEVEKLAIFKCYKIITRIII